MKKIYILLILFSLSFAFYSCGDDWLKQEPSTSVIKDGEDLKFVEDAYFRLNGIYPLIRAYEYYGARMTYYGDVTGEDLQAVSGTKRASSYYTFRLTKDNATSSFWNTCYKIIANANVILSQIDNLKGDNDAHEAERLDYKGQALALRALAHFDLTRLYGYPFPKDDGASLGVPIVLKPVDRSYKPKRDKVVDCYKVIIDDLTEAVGTPDNKNKGLLKEGKNEAKFNRWAAMALLSRVYLYRGTPEDNVLALAYAEAAIKGAEKNGLRLWTNEEYTAAWADEFSVESLFEIPLTPAEHEGKDAIGYLYYASGYDDIIMTDDFIDLISEDKSDVRYKSIINNTSAGSKSGRRYLWKYPANPSDNKKREYSNIKMLRLSELYLIAAEAAVKVQDNAKALTYLNAIVTRANPKKSVSGEVTIDRVLIERRKELVGEGHRMFDAMRNNKRIVRAGASHLPLIVSDAWDFGWDYYKIVLPIPRTERLANENLNTPDQQNPGY